MVRRAVWLLPLLLLLLTSACSPAEGQAQWPALEKEALEQAQQEMHAEPEVLEASARVIERRVHLEITVTPDISGLQAENLLEDYARRLSELHAHLEAPRQDYLGELWEYYYLEVGATCPDGETIASGYRCIRDPRPGIVFN